MRRTLTASLILTSCLARLQAEDKTLEVVHQIKAEAFDNSKVMEHLSYLADMYGPRLTASPEFQQAADWAMSRLKEYGVANVHAEKWGPFGRSWSLQNFTLEMTAPRYSHLVAFPLAWSAPTNGAQSGDLLFAPMKQGKFGDITENKKELKEYEATWKGKLKGKIVLVSEAKMPKPSEKPLFRRYTDAELADIGKSPEPSIRRNIPIDQVKIPSDEEEAYKYFESLPEATIDQIIDQFFELINEMGRFFHDEGAVGIIRADQRAHNGLLFAESAGSHKAKDPMAPPTFVVTEEQYSRMTRLIEKKQAVSVRMNLQAKASTQDIDGLDIIGEIPGQKKPDQVVMIGAHYDSWHSGTGATDNGAGSAVMIEVMRILKAQNLKMDRTVRIGLWSGEEQGLYGSKAYVKAHFADPKTMQVKPEHSQLDAYLNLDNGSGRIRGVYLQGNDAARPLFEKWLEPFRDLGVTTMSLKNTGGTDHLSFDAVGLPGFQFIQDPLDYNSVTHHSDMDTYDHAVPEDLMQASAVIATLVYDIANADEEMPRKPLPLASEAK
ncbi:MAG: M20/M25/M40 family metallo-hydrolase [Acidobacteriaceae bacterium]|nr:M20/M25/M40 family metallo-hydrolase [Acidobacteriaceae bacterium]MBV9778716.1 M20/M25/M40 family metallo-hydrolase [Acidobacteriaceae bacterium]